MLTILFFEATRQEIILVFTDQYTMSAPEWQQCDVSMLAIANQVACTTVATIVIEDDVMYELFYTRMTTSNDARATLVHVIETLIDNN